MMSTIGTLICGSSSRGRRDERQRAHDECGQEEERRQRRVDESARQNARKAELHGATTTSPSLRPERISTPFDSQLARLDNDLGAVLELDVVEPARR